MPRLSVIVLTVLIAPLAALLLFVRQAPVQAADKPAAGEEFTRHVQPFVAKHCIACHNDKKKRADLSLTKYTDDLSLLKDQKRWESIVKIVQSGEMPPEDRPRPKADEITAFVKGVDGAFARAAKQAGRDPGRVTIRRLNRVEYANTIRDLVGVPFNPAEDFPADDVGYGFDNIGDVLSLSPILMERYLAAAEAIVTSAVLTEKPTPPSRRVAATFLAPRSPVREPRVRSLYKKGDAVYAQSPAWPALEEDGEYIIRIRGTALPDGDKPARFAITDNGQEIKTVEVAKGATFAPGRPPLFEMRLSLKKGEHRVGVQMLSDFKAPEQPEVPGQGRPIRSPGVHVFQIELEGPLDFWPSSHRRIMACSPDKPKREQAREILTRFASKAYRRPVEPSDVERLLKLMDVAQARGEKWEAGIQLALQAVLTSPKFLFRVELDDRPDSKDPHPIDEYHLASRLSYFLWSSMPDDELFGLAAKKQLSSQLDAQVKRMLADPKARALTENFAVQWLQLRNLKTFAPDPKLFPNFDERLRAAMQKETELFFDAVLREDRSILDLLDADFTFVNGRLARHYGIDGVYGDTFRRVKLTDGKRGGILTQASVLTVTSNPTRTSPVKRGKWVMEQILGTPPPEPPPNAPPLPNDEKSQLTGSLRQRMEQHRKDPNCAVCHEHMDALGFAFENYDAVGTFRTKDGSFPIDPSGTLIGGLSFKGPQELKAILKGKKELFARCLTEKMLTYALGRGLEYYDRPTVDAIVAALERNDYRFSTLITEITRSDPFRLRRGKE